MCSPALCRKAKQQQYAEFFTDKVTVASTTQNDALQANGFLPFFTFDIEADLELIQDEVRSTEVVASSQQQPGEENTPVDFDNWLQRLDAMPAAFATAWQLQQPQAKKIKSDEDDKSTDDGSEPDTKQHYGRKPHVQYFWRPKHPGKQLIELKDRPDCSPKRSEAVLICLAAAGERNEKKTGWFCLHSGCNFNNKPVGKQRNKVEAHAFTHLKQKR